MKHLSVLGVAALALMAACGPSRETQQKLEQLQVVSAEKDSLIQIVTENTRLMSEIAREVAQVMPENQRLAVAGESPYQLNQDSLRTMVQHVTQRVKDSEERLARSERRIRNLANASDSLKAQIETYAQVVADLTESIENQKLTVASLNERLEQLQYENVRLAEAKAAVEDTLRNVETQHSTAYYVVGTKNELKERGIIVEEGGTRFPLLFTRVGETLVPANDLDPSQFNEIDIRAVQEIPLPDTTASYKVVSVQDLTALDSIVQDGKVRGALRIANPREFWTPSRFLILVRT